jgi:hypothetical protein
LIAMIWSESVAPIWFNPPDGGLRTLEPHHWLARLAGAPAPAAVYGLMAAACVGAVGLTAGLGARVCALVTLQTLLALFALHPRTGGAHDRLIANALWLLVLAPSDHSLSLRARLWGRGWLDPTPAPLWTRWLVILQLTLMYASTGMQKVGAEWFVWGELSAVQRALLSPSWARWDLTPLAAHITPLLQAATALSWLWEVTFVCVPLWLWARATRTRPGRWRAISNRIDLRSWMAAGGIVMHLILLLLLELGPFSLISLALYPCLFSGAEWRRWLGRPADDA